MKLFLFTVFALSLNYSFASDSDDKSLYEIFESGSAIKLTVVADGIRVPMDEWSVKIGECAISMKEPSSKTRVLRRNREIIVTDSPGHGMFRMMTRLDHSVAGIILPEHTRVSKIGAGTMVHSPGGIFKYTEEVERRQGYTFSQLKEDCSNSGIMMEIVPLPVEAYEDANLNHNNSAESNAVI